MKSSVLENSEERGHLEDDEGDYLVGLLDQGLYLELCLCQASVCVYGGECIVSGLEQLAGCWLSNL